jgi:hypothetical protein
MKIPYTLNGVLENMVDLVGYERLCPGQRRGVSMLQPNR